MRYEVTLDGPAGGEPAAAITVDVTELPGGEMEARVDGQHVEIDVLTLGNVAGRRLNVRVDGQVVDLTTEGNLPDLFAVALGHRARVRVETERWRSAARIEPARTGRSSRVVQSPMPGRVIKLLVAVGESVQPGQGLVVLEAMKMENEVCARSAGTVAAIHVAAGAAVEGGAKLVTLT